MLYDVMALLFRLHLRGISETNDDSESCVQGTKGNRTYYGARIASLES